MHWIMNRVAVFGKGENESDVWNLVPLTPEYVASEHGDYVKAIEAALNNDQIRNIALTGNYGVGKSSILHEVARRQKDRVVELSLSTLAPITPSKLDESVPPQATTPTNRIQQEIVKQLLYREEPGKMPGSRFSRIGRFRWRHEVATALMLGFVATVVFLLAGWSALIVSTFVSLDDLSLGVHLLVWGAATAVILIIRYLSYGQVHIKQFSAGPATVTLDDKSMSYFDQYLDEIVYFFELSKRNIVIFEDIDRFNDSHIFETLRSLNTLLNASPQIGKPIRFIYAIKDSIFDRIGLEAEGRKLETSLLAIEDPARAEVIRANRTKFFDLVIPVVPFITHRSARNLAVRLLGENNLDIAPELFDLAGQYVPDMRLLKNVHNEFTVFHSRIFAGEGKRLNLSETELFAMMLYKSTHLADFEAIQLGRSKLDDLYRISRDLVTENIRRVERERGTAQQQLARINGAATRSEQLGDRLLAHIRRTAEAAGYLDSQATYKLEQKAITVDDFRSTQFWKDLASADKGVVLRWRNTNSQPLTFSREHIADVLGDSLDSEIWDIADRAFLTEQIAEHAEQLSFLRGADLGDLINRPEFLVEYGQQKQSFAAVAQTLLKLGLAYHLVRAGYINRNFTLYTSTFHGDRVSTAATNFIIHHVERDMMDEHFKLDAKDVDAIIREQGKQSLQEPAFYNIDILDHLLRTDETAADVMIGSLVSLGENQSRFRQAYLSGGTERDKFITRFTKVSSQVFDYVVTDVTLNEELRLELVDVALDHLSDSIKYRKHSDVSSYLVDHYAELKTMSSLDTTTEQAERIAALFDEFGVTLPLLEPLSKQMRQSFVSRNLYKIGRENLAIAIGDAPSLALDCIQDAAPPVYGYAISNLSAYLAAVEDVAPTVEKSTQFIPVIEDVLSQDDLRLGKVIERASAECIVSDLSEVSDKTWPALAEHARFRATFANVSAYIGTIDGLDTHLAKVLASAGSITEIGGRTEEAKSMLARTILVSRDVLPSAALRVQLVASLELENYISVDDIEAEEGEMFALLLKHDIIVDDAVAYGALLEMGWPTREAFIHASAAFKDYVTPALVQGDLGALLLSDKVDMTIKRKIVEQASDFVVGAERNEVHQLAQFAAQHQYQTSLDVVQEMASVGASPRDVVILLEPHLDSLTCEQLTTILQSLSGEYSKLASLGRDRPTLPNTAADRALLESLKACGIVSTYDERTTSIKVHKKHK